jgi:hypothetical protein
MTIDFLD